MKRLDKYSRVSGALEKLFRQLNDRFFDGEIETPIITIQASSRSYAHVSVDKISTVDGQEARRELNLSATYLQRDVSEISASLLHECCHLYAMQNGIKDTSRNGSYHNKRFKEIAESHGIIVSYDPRIGWSPTEPSDELIEWLCDIDIEDIRINRGNIEELARITGTGGAEPAPVAPPKVTTTGRRGNSIRWICPGCGAIVRSTKQVNIICGDCGVPFVMS